MKFFSMLAVLVFNFNAFAFSGNFKLSSIVCKNTQYDEVEEIWRVSNYAPNVNLKMQLTEEGELRMRAYDMYMCYHPKYIYGSYKLEGKKLKFTLKEEQLIRNCSLSISHSHLYEARSVSMQPTKTNFEGSAQFAGKNLIMDFPFDFNGDVTSACAYGKCRCFALMGRVEHFL